MEEINFTANSLSIDPRSYWVASTEETGYPKLEEDKSTDVVIIGGGLVGITTAYLLKQEGFKVILLEADGIAQGVTGHTTAKITSQHGLMYAQLNKIMGLEKAFLYADANEKAIGIMDKLVQEKNIDCDFLPQPAYIYTCSGEYVNKLEEEADIAASLGIKAQYLDKVPLPFSVKAAVRFDGQAQFHPRKYLLALAKEIPGEGSEIFEQTRATDIIKDNINTVVTGNGCKISAKSIVVASHYPFYDKPGLYFTRIYPERSYVLAVTIKEKFPPGMFINAEYPTRSLRSQQSKRGELVLVGGEGHKTGRSKSTIENYKKLKDFAQQTFSVEDYKYRWSTQDCVTMDGVPYVGQLAASTPNVYIATGFKKWGMTNGTAAAVVIRDLIIEKDNPWVLLYNPSRFTPKASAATFVKESIGVAKSFIEGKLSSSKTQKDQPAGAGKEMQIDGLKVGGYQDEEGTLHLVDIKCTHLGCKLKWNDAEVTWDCPCHGSRFNHKGKVVHGPAVKPLNKLK